MDSALSPQLKALCEQASHEYDPGKLLELTKQITDLLEQQNRDRELEVNGALPKSGTA
jgi:hypothetical protein